MVAKNKRRWKRQKNDQSAVCNKAATEIDPLRITAQRDKKETCLLTSKLDKGVSACFDWTTPANAELVQRSLAESDAVSGVERDR
jgi:hypothetical protein